MFIKIIVADWLIQNVGYLRFPLAPRLAFFWAAASSARRTKKILHQMVTIHCCPWDPWASPIGNFH